MNGCFWVQVGWWFLKPGHGPLCLEDSVLCTCVPPYKGALCKEPFITPPKWAIGEKQFPSNQLVITIRCGPELKSVGGRISPPHFAWFKFCSPVSHQYKSPQNTPHPLLCTSFLYLFLHPTPCVSVIYLPI